MSNIWKTMFHSDCFEIKTNDIYLIYCHVRIKVIYISKAYMRSGGLSVNLLCGISLSFKNSKLTTKKWTLGIIPSLVDFEILTAVTVKRYYLVGRNAV